jgi:RNA polymerase sigma factor FliA
MATLRNDGTKRVGFDGAQSRPAEFPEVGVGVIAAAVAALPLRERAILSLYYVEGLTMTEVANVMDVSQSRISQLMERARTRLRADPAFAAAA